MFLLLHVLSKLADNRELTFSQFSKQSTHVHDDKKLSVELYKLLWYMHEHEGCNFKWFYYVKSVFNDSPESINLETSKQKRIFQGLIDSIK